MRNLQNELRNKEYEDSNEIRKDKLRQGLLLDPENDNTMGTSIILTGEPRLKVHHKRQQLREKMTANTYRKVVEENSKHKYDISSDGMSLEIKPDKKYLSIHEWCEKEQKYALEEQVKSNRAYK